MNTDVGMNIDSDGSSLNSSSKVYLAVHSKAFNFLQLLLYGIEYI